MPAASASPAKGLIAPDNHLLIVIDLQSQMAFAAHSIDTITLRNNAALVAKSAAGFMVPTILTTVAEMSFSGPTFDEIKDAFPGQAMIDRTSMNTWEDMAVIAEVNRIGKNRIVLAGLWTSVCIVGPALSALEQGFEVYVIADACGDVSDEAHNRAMERMIQAGVRPMTASQNLLELQRDWARGETYALTTGIAAINGGGCGLWHNLCRSHGWRRRGRLSRRHEDLPHRIRCGYAGRDTLRIARSAFSRPAHCGAGWLARHPDWRTGRAAGQAIAEW